MKRWLLPFAFGIGCGSPIATEPGQGSASTGTADSDAAGSSTSTSAPADSSDSGTSSGATSTTGTPSTTSAIAWETEGADEGYATTGGCGFTCPPPPGPGNGFGCTFTGQDCGEGEQCMPWANDGGNAWNSLRCVPLADRPGGVGERCHAEGSFVSGIDSCDIGLWCGAENAEDGAKLQGVCHQLCNGGPCPAGTICLVPDVVDELPIGVCEEPCNPLTPLCPSGQACMPAGFGFACHPAAQENNEGCNAHTQCQPGFGCIDAPQCEEGAPCCARWCDLDAPDCAQGETCTDFGSPLSAYASVGYCAG